MSIENTYLKLANLLRIFPSFFRLSFEAASAQRPLQLALSLLGNKLKESKEAREGNRLREPLLFLK